MMALTPTTMKLSANECIVSSGANVSGALPDAMRAKPLPAALTGFGLPFSSASNRDGTNE